MSSRIARENFRGDSVFSSKIKYPQIKEVNTLVGDQVPIATANPAFCTEKTPAVPPVTQNIPDMIPRGVN